MNKKIKGAELNQLMQKIYLLVELGELEHRKEDNPYLLHSYRGTGNNIATTWNIKIYRKCNDPYKENFGKYSVVCTDFLTIEKFKSKSDKKVISIDDSGWGFPLGGVLIGICDGNEVVTGIVTEKYFQGSFFSSQRYLYEFSRVGQQILENLCRKIGATTDTHRVEICTGFVNEILKNDLRKTGFEVSVVKIEGLLQDTLENMHKEYIKELIGADIYYDPKDMPKENIPREYKDSVYFGIKNCPHLLKTGWDSMKKLGIVLPKIKVENFKPVLITKGDR